MLVLIFIPQESVHFRTGGHDLLEKIEMKSKPSRRSRSACWMILVLYHAWYLVLLDVMFEDGKRLLLNELL